MEDQGEQITVETSEGIKFNLDEDALAGIMSSLECLRDERNIKRGTYRNLFSCLSFSEQFIYGYVKIFSKDCYLIIRNTTVSLFDAQDSRIAALHA